MQSDAQVGNITVQCCMVLTRAVHLSGYREQQAARANGSREQALQERKEQEQANDPLTKWANLLQQVQDSV